MYMDTVNEILPIHRTLAVLDGKWKIAIIYCLFEQHTLRFNQLRRMLPGITQKMLTAQLRALEQDGIIHREIFPVVPPKVEYTLTSKGTTLCPILEAMRSWDQMQKELE